MKELSFNDIINKEKGKIAIVVGLGPSLLPDLEKIKKLDLDKYVIISCNDVDLITDLNFNYWVWANSIDNIEKTYIRLNRKKSTLVFADSVDPTPRNRFQSLLECDYLPYDQRHFNGNHCTWGNGLNGRASCCNNMVDGRLTIQEELKKYCNFQESYGGGETVAVHMLSLAILLGCKEIYITGVDLDYSKGYVNGKSHYDSFNQYLPSILDRKSVV